MVVWRVAPAARCWLYRAETGRWRAVGSTARSSAFSRARTASERNPACRSALWWVACRGRNHGGGVRCWGTHESNTHSLTRIGNQLPGALRGAERRRVRGGDDRLRRHRRRLDPQSRLQGRHPARQRGQAERLRRQERSRRARSTPASSTPAEIGKVNTAGVADGLARHGVISNAGALIRGRGITSASKTGEGQYQAILDADVRNCTYSATLGDESAVRSAAPARSR